jgi:hypothetical protein
MASQNDIRQQITRSIVEALEKGGVPPWRRPWKVGKNTGPHANALSRRSYRGLNPLLLDSQPLREHPGRKPEAHPTCPRHPCSRVRRETRRRGATGTNYSQTTDDTTEGGEINAPI